MSQYRMTFQLADLAFCVPPGRHRRCLAGCTVHVDRAGHVTITGQSREQLFQQCRRFIRLVARGHGPMSIPASVLSPEPAGRGPWRIIVEADVAFAASRIDPEPGPKISADASTKRRQGPWRDMIDELEQLCGRAG